MSDIQRYAAQVGSLPSRKIIGDKDYAGWVDVVLYADHVAEMEALEIRLGRHYEQVMKARVAEAEFAGREWGVAEGIKTGLSYAVAAVEALPIDEFERINAVDVRDTVIEAIKAVGHE